VQVLRGFGIKEMVRTGVVAMVRGPQVAQESDKVRELTA
jgi:acetolactate synthase small subunit